MMDASCQLPDPKGASCPCAPLRARGGKTVNARGPRHLARLSLLLLWGAVPAGALAQAPVAGAPEPDDALPMRAQAADPAAPRGNLMDAVVATLDEVLITRSDLVFESRVHGLAQEGTASLSRSLNEKDLQRALERTLAERLHAREAERLGVVPPTPQELEAQLQLIESRAGGAGILEAFLRVHGSDRVQLTALIERGELAERAKESRVRVRAQVTEAELRRAWESSGSKGPFADERDALADKLRAERAREIEGRELERLLRNAKVRRIATWARLTAGQGR